MTLATSNTTASKDYGQHHPSMLQIINEGQKKLGNSLQIEQVVCLGYIGIGQDLILSFDDWIFALPHVLTKISKSFMSKKEDFLQVWSNSIIGMIKTFRRQHLIVIKTFELLIEDDL